jgi:DNA repair protein RecO (recombination protein O)
VSNVVTTEAIVLRSMKYRETSKIVTFYTKHLGKISGIVKGARRAKSPFGSSLEPMSYVSLVVYVRPGRGLQTVAQCDVIRPFRRLGEELGAMAAGMSIIELVGLVAHEEEENHPLFELVRGSLEALNAPLSQPPLLFCHFELKLMDILGFRPSFDRCLACDGDVGEGEATFHVGRGGLLCPGCSSHPGATTQISSGTVGLLRQLDGIKTAVDGVHLSVEEGGIGEAERLLWSFLRFHVSGVTKLNSEKVFAKIMAGP